MVKKIPNYRDRIKTKKQVSHVMSFFSKLSVRGTFIFDFHSIQN